MLTKWIVDSYKVIVEIALWAFLVIGGLVGCSLGAVVDHGFLGFLIGAVAGFFGMPRVSLNLRHCVISY